MTTGALSTSQISRARSGWAGEKSFKAPTLVLLVPEVEDVPVGLGCVENAVGAREGLDQAMMLEVLIDVECVEELCVKAGEEHIHDDGHVNLFVALAGQVPANCFFGRSHCAMIS